MRNLEGTESVLLFESKQKTEDVFCPFCHGSVHICDMTGKTLKYILHCQSVFQVSEHRGLNVLLQQCHYDVLPCVGIIDRCDDCTLQNVSFIVLAGQSKSTSFLRTLLTHRHTVHWQHWQTCIWASLSHNACWWSHPPILWNT